MSGSHSIAYYDISGDYLGDYSWRVGSGPEAATEAILCMAGPNSTGELITWCCDTSGDDQFCTGLLGSGPCVVAGGPPTISEEATSSDDPLFTPASTVGGSLPSPSPPTSTSPTQTGSQTSSGPPFTSSSSSSLSSSIPTASLSPDPSPGGSTSTPASSLPLPLPSSSSSTSTGTSSSPSQVPSTPPLSITDTSSRGSSRALPTGAIVGIAVGSAVGLFLLYLVFRRCRTQNRHI
ncbi:hypothetical protein SISSUDRAFT_1068009 [Sistotremastrum suecicum HHB10207 ss-3]|uniref:Uncharacterized protein n=1 Tax=Sistotremastrum suecicum HHB10207 ss-3 TaxID=1314776 RepID=A0A165WHV7_9AGAM|nr:hypothetical protein SISSUDRAFT_1068009 [Sistotremastrum suecicum HHB10207 ss-3]